MTKTYSAHELRLNLGEIFRQVADGYDVIITYGRGKKAMQAKLTKTKAKPRKTLIEAFEEFQQSNKDYQPSEFVKNATYQELKDAYYEDNKSKYGF